MAVLFNQHWDVAPVQAQPNYERFILDTYNPTLNGLGLELVGGYYVTVGMGPRIILVARTQTMSMLEAAIASPEFDTVTGQLQQYVSGYHSKILVPTHGAVMEQYEIQSGMCKYTQYWNVLPGRGRDYIRFLQDEFVPSMESAGIPLADGWRVVVGSGPQIVTESAAPSILDIAKALETRQFRTVARELKTRYVTDYHSRILHPTGRVELPTLLNEMLSSF